MPSPYCPVPAPPPPPPTQPTESKPDSKSFTAAELDEIAANLARVPGTSLYASDGIYALNKDDVARLVAVARKNASRLSDLISRVEIATEGDRGLDWELHCLNGIEGVGSYGAHPSYTASLEAAVALCERMLPGKAWMTWVSFPKTVDEFYGAAIDDGENSYSKTPALALCLALLRALQETEKS